jgi:transposase-like protein
MNKPITCPVCGSSDFSVVESTKEVRDLLASKEVVVNNYSCNTCNATGDFADSNDSILEQALEDVKLSTVSSIIDEFCARMNTSLAGIERALELPQRTLVKWKRRAVAPSAAGVALLKVIHTYPWVMEVAQSGYDPLYSRYKLAEEGAKALYYDFGSCFGGIPSSVNIQQINNYGVMNINASEGSEVTMDDGSQTVEVRNEVA